MNTSSTTINGITVIKPPGAYLDASRSKEFRRDVVEPLPSPSRVILDLSEIQFIDSSGCGAILAAARQANPSGQGPGDLKICGVTKHVRLVFEMVRIHKILEIYNTREEAIRAFEVDSIAFATT